MAALFKLTKTNGLTRRVTFPTRPTWSLLSGRIANLYDIAIEKIAVSYIDSDGDNVTLSSDGELQDFYLSPFIADKDTIKFAVHDLSGIRTANTASADDRDLLWLQELYSKIWDRKDLRPTLFREVKVTRALYDELQDRLNRKCSDRTSKSKEYEGSYVLNDKLNFLTWANSPEADNNEDRMDDDDIEAGNENGNESDFEIFPSTLPYLDLSPLHLKNKSDRFPLPLFCRQEYDHISKLIEKKSYHNGLGSVMVSGQSGTGEVLVSPSRRI